MFDDGYVGQDVSRLDHVPIDHKYPGALRQRELLPDFFPEDNTKDIVFFVRFQLHLAVNVGKDCGVLGHASLEDFLHLWQAAGDIEVLRFHVLADYVRLPLQVVAVPVRTAEDPVELVCHSEVVLIGAPGNHHPVDRLLQLLGLAGPAQIVQYAFDYHQQPSLKTGVGAGDFLDHSRDFVNDLLQFRYD